MFSSRASQESSTHDHAQRTSNSERGHASPTLSASPLQSSVTILTPAADSGSQAIPFTQDVILRDARWIVGAAVLYFALVIVTTLTLHPYFSQTWDVVTFINAGKSALSPEWSALYAQSRADRYWPYAYPPLHAFVVAPFVAVGGWIPDYLLVRVPPLLFDLALGILLYVIVAHKTQNKNFARLAMLIWLLNPVTWYDTAVQGHFEAEWLFFVVLAYFLYETKRDWILPSLALAIAFLFKQNAILFAMPLWAHLFFASDEKGLRRRVSQTISSMIVFAIPILVVSLPFLLSSNDYWYMNVQYVADVPLQTQSWLVALAGMFGAENILLRASSILTFLAAALISIVAARRKMSVWLIATLIVLAFFLLSKKVVGYYYVMLLPFAIITLIPTKQFRLLLLIVVAISFISLSPYFASWANQDHWWIYSLPGMFNSALWVGIFVWLWRGGGKMREMGETRALAFLSLALFFSAVAAALLQPFVNSQTSPIRAPLIANGFEMQALFVFFGYIAIVLVTLFAAVFFTRSLARASQIPPGAYALVVLLAPLYFLTYTLTKESTAALELLLKIIGI